MVFGIDDGDEDSNGSFDLVGTQHVILIQTSARIPEEIRVCGWSDGATVVILERLDYIVSLVAEVEDKRIVLEGVDAIQSRKSLNSR